MYTWRALRDIWKEEWGSQGQATKGKNSIFKALKGKGVMELDQSERGNPRGNEAGGTAVCGVYVRFVDRPLCSGGYDCSEERSQRESGAKEWNNPRSAL